MAIMLDFSYTKVLLISLVEENLGKCIEELEIELALLQIKGD